jgi:hypothetical protein
MTYSSGSIVGEHYLPFTHQAGCTAAPWEDCPCLPSPERGNA